MQGMGADQEISQDPIPLASCLAIGRVGHAGRIAMLGRERDGVNAALLQPPVELLAIAGLRGQFGVDDGRDDQAALLLGPDQQRFGAVRMLGIVDQHVQEDGRIARGDHRPRMVSI